MTVSIITPTTPQRAHFLPRLQAMIQAQTVQPLEWLVDSSDNSIGAKRNNLCAQAKGDIIIHMDDDDLYGPEWVAHSIEGAHRADITGLSSGYFYGTASNELHEFKRTDQMFILGATMAYKRSTWNKRHFQDISNGEDLYFSANRSLHCHGYKEGFAAVIHGNNTTSHKAFKAMKRVQATLPLLSLLQQIP